MLSAAEVRFHFRRFFSQPPRLQQHRFLSRPQCFNVGWGVRVIHDTAGEKGGINIPLHPTRSIAQRMPALTERLFRAGLGRVVVLRHFQRPGVQINQRAASTFSLATQLFDQHARRSDFDALAKILLEGDIRQGFGLDNLAQSENLICQLTVRPLALGGQLAFDFGHFNTEGRVPFGRRELLPPLRRSVRVKTVRLVARLERSIFRCKRRIAVHG